MFHKIEYIQKADLSRASNTIIRIDDNHEFTTVYDVVNHCFHIEDIKGDLKFTKTTATATYGKGELDVIYNNSKNTFNAYVIYGNGIYTFYITANIEMKEKDIREPLPASAKKCPCNNYVSSKEDVDKVHAAELDSTRPPCSQPNESKWFKILSNDCYADAFLTSFDKLKVPTHRCILAEFSNVFAELIAQKKELPVTINVENLNGETIKAALDFLHGRHDAIIGKEAEVFKFAVQYNIKEIMVVCCTFFEESVDPSNVCEYIQIAYTNNFEELKQKCLKILVEKKKEIDPSKFAKLPKSILSDFFAFF